MGILEFLFLYSRHLPNSSCSRRREKLLPLACRDDKTEKWIELRSEENFLRQITICNKTRLDDQMMTLKTRKMFLYMKLCSVNILFALSGENQMIIEKSWRIYRLGTTTEMTKPFWKQLSLITCCQIDFSLSKKISSLPSSGFSERHFFKCILE